MNDVIKCVSLSPSLIPPVQNGIGGEASGSGDRGQLTAKVSVLPRFGLDGESAPPPQSHLHPT